MDHSDHCHAEPSGPKIGRKLQIASGIFLIVLAASFLQPLTPLNQSLLDYLSII